MVSIVADFDGFVSCGLELGLMLELGHPFGLADQISENCIPVQWRPLAGDTDYEAFDMGAKIMKLNINLGELGEFEEVQQLGDIVKSRYEPVEQIPLFATHADKVTFRPPPSALNPVGFRV